MLGCHKLTDLSALVLGSNNLVAKRRVRCRIVYSAGCNALRFVMICVAVLCNAESTNGDEVGSDWRQEVYEEKVMSWRRGKEAKSD